MSHITTSSNYQGFISHQSQNVPSKVLSSGNVLRPGQSMTGETVMQMVRCMYFSKKRFTQVDFKRILVPVKWTNLSGNRREMPLDKAWGNHWIGIKFHEFTYIEVFNPGFYSGNDFQLFVGLYYVLTVIGIEYHIKLSWSLFGLILYTALNQSLWFEQHVLWLPCYTNSSD